MLPSNRIGYVVAPALEDEGRRESWVMEATSALWDGVELRFGRQPCDAISHSGLAFRDVDAAAIRRAAEATVGARFVAEVPGWSIECRRTRDRLIDVTRVVRSVAPAGRRVNTDMCWH
jgi:hypothetical protein